MDAQVRGGQAGGAAAAAAAQAAAAAAAAGRVCCVCRDDSLRTCVERLATPGVRRLVVVARDSRRVEGIVSLSDMAGFLFGMAPT
jgi:CBS domain-containing protein